MTDRSAMNRRGLFSLVALAFAPRATPRPTARWVTTRLGRRQHPAALARIDRLTRADIEFAMAYDFRSVMNPTPSPERIALTPRIFSQNSHGAPSRS